MEVAQDRADGGLGRRAGGAERCREGSGYQSVVEASLAGFGARLYLGMINDGGIESLRWNHGLGSGREVILALEC